MRSSGFLRLYTMRAPNLCGCSAQVRQSPRVIPGGQEALLAINASKREGKPVGLVEPGRDDLCFGLGLRQGTKGSADTAATSW